MRETEKIVQLCPAAPGWRYLFMRSRTEIWEVHVACWALLESGRVVGMGAPYSDDFGQVHLLDAFLDKEIIKLLMPDDNEELTEDEIAFQDDYMNLIRGIDAAKAKHHLSDEDAEWLKDSLTTWDYDKAEAICQYAKEHKVSIHEAVIAMA